MDEVVACLGVDCAWSIPLELPRRKPEDIYIPDGAFGNALEDLKRQTHLHDLTVAIVYAFDMRTHMLPFWYADKRMAACSVRLLGDCLSACGFRNLRLVLQQWTPNFSPCMARINGQPLDILMVSAMQVHAERAYDLVRDAHRMGDARPLILAGGPKAIYEPTDYFELGPTPGISADCVSTGEAYVLLDFLRLLGEHMSPGESPRLAFERIRRVGMLDDIPGLVYLSPDAPPDRPIAVNTGVQRLLRDLDEMPLPDMGYRLLEPPHRRSSLSARPIPANRVGKLSTIASVISTQGCKFNCNYCPIPAVNQRTWRHKSAARLTEEIALIHRNFGIREFFSTDDNFFNTRQTVVELMSELARAQVNGRSLGKEIRFYTEATQFDVHKNRDILPLCREAGLRAIWFGIEDITAELINKGQNSGKTAELFGYLHRIGIEPMAMMMHSDDQPLHSPKGDLSGLVNQASYLFDTGAVSYQCTYLSPAVGTRSLELMANDRMMYKRVGHEPVPQAYQDGNHVVASKHPRPWEKQLNVLRGYEAFYNPRNTWRAITGLGRDRMAPKRLAFQLIGQIGLMLTKPKLKAWARKLEAGPIEYWEGLQKARIPMIDATQGQEISWSIEHVPQLAAEETPRRRAAASMPELVSAE